ncbi:MAG: hypothetical protein RIR52_582 [Acidobacteriota bacterium]|jgi:hypothetical protein
MKTRIAISILSLTLALFVVGGPSVRGWGAHGHAISGKAAATRLPDTMPGFFRKAADQLSYLNPEPDRWRDRLESQIDRGMDTAAAPDHFLDLELVPASARQALNRYDFTAEMIKAGQKPTTAGFSPYRMLELFQQLRISFRLWRVETDRQKRQWIEQRIINDAGILGHYVTDTANPHHTTIHFNGWSGPNPNEYTTYSRERGIHFRFEEEFVGARIAINDIYPLMVAEARTIRKPREELWDFVQKSNALVEQLYILDKQEPFAATTTSAAHKKFAVERLAAGATMLRDLWWTAWITSDDAKPAAKR